MPKIDTNISVGNILTIGTILFGGIMAWFAIVEKVNASDTRSLANQQSIITIQEKTDGLDVIEFKVDMNAKSLARIENILADEK